MRQLNFDGCERITADDLTIQAALQDAHIPSLMVALVHLTGDASMLRGSIPPSSDFNTFLADPQGGISEEQQATIRGLALDALKAYRDGGGRLPPPPPQETVHEMMNFIIGQTVSEDYISFLMAELALNREDPYAQPIDNVPDTIKQRFHVLIIGAGMSGLLAAIRLQEAGLPYTVVEKNADVGGTWFENTYPGCRVDSPNHIEDDDTRKRAEALQEIGIAGQLVEELDVRDDPGHKDQIAWPVTDHLVGDADVAAASVARLGEHAPSIRPAVCGGQSTSSGRQRRVPLRH